VSEPKYCTVCDKRELWRDDDFNTGVCSVCRAHFGLRHQRVASPRPPLPCQRCNHTVLVRCQVRERAARGDEPMSEYLAPLAVTFRRQQRTSFWSGRTKVRDIPDLASPAGMLEAFVCRRCGFVDWYAQSPEDIPIGVEFGTELIDVSGTRGGPFR
jgi:hypothetical protein